MAKQSFAEQMRKKINAKAEKAHKARKDKTPFENVVVNMEEAKKIIHIDKWIPMPKWFTIAAGIKEGQGLPCGHIMQVVGPPESGKTTLLCEMIKACHDQDGMVFFIDAEKKFEIDRLLQMGGKPTDDNFSLIPCKKMSLEAVWACWKSIMESLVEVRADIPDKKILVIWDSLPASTPKKIEDSVEGSAHMAVDAKINNQEVRKLRNLITESEVATVIINHSYSTVPKTPFEFPREVLKGGEEMEFHTIACIKLQKGAKITREITRDGIELKQKIGRVTKISWIKNQLSSRPSDIQMTIGGPGYMTPEQVTSYKESLKGKI